jgi:hypothetical protein
LQHIAWHSESFASSWLEFKNAIAVETRLALAFATIHEQHSPLPRYFGIGDPSGVASGMIPL